MAPKQKGRVPTPRGGRPGERRPLGPRPISALWYILGFLFLLALVQAYLFVPRGRTIPYSEFKALLAADRVAEVTVSAEVVRGQLTRRARIATAAPSPPRAWRTRSSSRSSSSAR